MSKNLITTANPLEPGEQKEPAKPGRSKKGGSGKPRQGKIRMLGTGASLEHTPQGEPTQQNGRFETDISGNPAEHPLGSPATGVNEPPLPPGNRAEMFHRGQHMKLTQKEKEILE